MNRRGFLRAAVSVVPMAAIGAPAASAAAGATWMGVVAADGVDLNALVGVTTMNITTAEGSAAGMFDKLAYAALDRVNEESFIRYQWWAIYRRHRIEVRKGNAQPESAHLIWDKAKLQIAGREQKETGRRPRLIKSKLKGPQSQKRRAARLKSMGYVTWPWGSPL